MSYMYGYENLMSDDSLEHYGVLGMKWGVRKKYRKQANREIREKKVYKSDQKTSIKLKNKAKAEREISKNSKTKFAKKYHNLKADNYQAKSDSYGKNYSNEAERKYSIKQTPIKNIDGSMTTLGKRKTQAMLAAGVGLLVLI